MNEIEEVIRQHSINAWRYFRVFIKWVLISAVVGAVGGTVGSLFYRSVTWATAIRQARPFFLWFLPAAGIFIVAVYRGLRVEGLGTNDVIDSILEGENIPILLMPVIFVSTAVTHLCGGSAGREGAALQIGGSIGCNVGKLLKLDEKEERLAILSGMSAVFSALFGTPVTAIVFALEVCSVGIIHYSGLVPCGVAAMTAFGVMKLFQIVPERYILPPFSHGGVMLLKVAALAVICAFVSILFCRCMHSAGHLAEKKIKNPYLRAVTGAALIILLTYLIGSQRYNGGGVEVIADAIEKGEADIPDFLFKILFTVITLSCGFKGGEIVPTFFIGSTLGCVVGPLLGLPAGFAAAIGLAATFCGAVNCPLTSVILSVELFGSEHILYFAAACFLSYMLSGYTSLYKEQKIVYSKLKAEYINRRAE